MKIQPTISCMSNNSNKTFKSVNLIQVPKSAFKEPDKVANCFSEFSHAINRVTDTKLNIFKHIKSFFLGATHATDCILENPSYYHAKHAMQDNQLDYSVNWLRHNTDLPVSMPLDNNYHSFMVCTKEHNPMIKSSIKKAENNSLLYLQEGRRRYPFDANMVNVYTETRIGVEAQRILDEELCDVPVKKFKISNLDEIKNITEQLDI